MAKTKNISLRFDEDDLKLAFEKTGLSKTQKLMDLLLSEYVRPFKKVPYFISSTKVDAYGSPVNDTEEWEKLQKRSKKTVRVGSHDFPIKEVEGLGDTWGMVPQFKNDIERMFWEEKQKLKNKNNGTNS